MHDDCIYCVAGRAPYVDLDCPNCGKQQWCRADVIGGVRIFYVCRTCHKPLLKWRSKGPRLKHE